MKKISIVLLLVFSILLSSCWSWEVNNKKNSNEKKDISTFLEKENYYVLCINEWSKNCSDSECEKQVKNKCENNYINNYVKNWNINCNIFDDFKLEKICLDSILVKNAFETLDIWFCDDVIDKKLCKKDIITQKAIKESNLNLCKEIEYNKVWKDNELIIDGKTTCMMDVILNMKKEEQDISLCDKIKDEQANKDCIKLLK